MLNKNSNKSEYFLNSFCKFSLHRRRFANITGLGEGDLRERENIYTIYK